MFSDHDIISLRSLEAFPAEMEGQQVIGLRDRLQYSPHVIYVQPHVFWVLAQFEGGNTIRDVQAAFMKQFGQLLRGEDVRGLLEQVDKIHFLDNERFAEFRQSVEEGFRQAETRPPSHVGGAYPEEPEELRRAFEAFFTAEGGAGEPGPAGSGKEVVAALAPHIDFERGGACYSWTYRALAESPPAELYVVLGTCHTPTNHPFVLTRKAFETPLGAAPTAAELVDRVAQRLQHSDPFEDEFRHRAEHSIEFQVVLLQYLFAGKHDYRILPVLCTLAPEVRSETAAASPGTRPAVAEFLDALGEVLQDQPGRICLIGSVDLAHVGARFGDSKPVTPAFMQQVEKEDRAMLECVSALDAEGFHQDVARDGDRRKICGHPPIYALLRLLPRCAETVEGKVLRYEQWADYQEGSSVTFTSLVFCRA